MSGDGRRALRVAEVIRARFAEAARRKLDDPKMAGLVVTDLQISDDLSIVDIRVRFMGVESEVERRRLLRKLQRVLPVLRRSVLDRLELRRAPELRLHHDDGAEAAQRVDQLLREIESERRGDE